MSNRQLSLVRCPDCNLRSPCPCSVWPDTGRRMKAAPEPAFSHPLAGSMTTPIREVKRLASIVPDVPMNAPIKSIKDPLGRRRSQGDHVYVVWWPDGVTKAGWSWYESRWRTFINRGADLVSLMSSDHYRIRDLESSVLDVMEKLGPRAFRSKVDAIPYLGGTGAGYMECHVLDESALLTLRIFLSGIPTKALD